MHYVRTGRHPWRGSGFTLIELLVVVAIIGLLMSILLPSLQRARRQAKAAVCAAHLRSVGQAVVGYQTEADGAFPQSYEYLDGQGSLSHSVGSAVGGYWHWSYALTSGGEVGEDSFTCPEIQNKGLPRTNPGPNPSHWASSPIAQQDDTGSKAGETQNPVEDKQVSRLAFTANAAVMPRNKWNSSRVPGPRFNRFVKDNEIKYASETILATEWGRYWTAAGGVSTAQSGAIVCKSHRPENPFFGGSQYDEYANSLNTPFTYGKRAAGSTDDPFTMYGLLSSEELEQRFSGNRPILDDQGSELNAVGRNHPGGDAFGDASNFLFVDGHVDRNTVLWSMDTRKWGDRYYAITGPNEVADFGGRAQKTDPGRR